MAALQPPSLRIPDLLKDIPANQECVPHNFSPRLESRRWEGVRYESGLNEPGMSLSAPATSARRNLHVYERSRVFPRAELDHKETTLSAIGEPRTLRERALSKLALCGFRLETRARARGPEAMRRGIRMPA